MTGDISGYTHMQEQTTSALMYKFAENLLRRRFGSLRHRAFLWKYVLEYSSFFSEEIWANIQVKKIREVFLYAQNTSFWSDCFWGAGFDPLEFRHFSELKKLPIVTRAELKRVPLQMLLASSLPKNRFVE